MARDLLQILIPLQMCLYIITAIKSQPPNIIIIVADDLGYNDVGYHGSNEIKTPTLDRLAAEGIKLENYYAQTLCSPSRSSLLFGRYIIHTGLQHRTIGVCAPYGHPLEDKSLADKLKENGYSTHITGKWHIGYYKEEYTPLYRGFDTFYGFYNADQDHYTHNMSTGDFEGVDFRVDLEPSNKTYGMYSTTIYTKRAQSIINNHKSNNPLFLYIPYQSPHDPYQVPEHYEKEFAHINDTDRRLYAAMVKAMDEGIGNITDTLKLTGLWNNTLLVFTSDNGGNTSSGGDNSPLRGGKFSYFEGGVKVVGFVSGPLIKNPGTINHQLMHVTDWYPTIINLVGGSLHGTNLDGYDMWQSIVHNKKSPRKEIIYNIDPMIRCDMPSESDVFDTSVLSALRFGDYKIITGYQERPPTHTMRNETQIVPCNQTIYLFNIVQDPLERQDLSQTEPYIVNLLLRRLAMWNQTAVPVLYPFNDDNCDPSLHGGFWTPWVKT